MTPVLADVLTPRDASAATVASAPTDLGTLGGVESSAAALNDAGQVVGSSYLAGNSVVHAFSWTQTGGMVDLGTLGGTSSYAVAVNATGQVVGTSRLSNGSDRAFSWTQSGGMINLGTLGGSYSNATAVNDAGQVVGYTSTAGDAATRAFSWTAAGGMVDLGTLGGSFSYTNQAKSVNSAGQVVGASRTPGDAAVHGFSWTGSGGMVDVGTLDTGVNSTPIAVSDSGQVVGTSDIAPDGIVQRAFSWTESGGLVDLGTLGGSYSSASAVSVTGAVVGTSALTEDVDTHPFFWTQSGGMIDLGTLGGHYNGAAKVNASGLVVGASGLAGDADYHAYAWTKPGGMADLGTLGGPTSNALDVNASGLIAGGATTAALANHAAVWQYVSSTDTTDPSVSFTSPVDNGVVSLGQSRVATFSCVDETSGSGLASCVGTVPSGSPLDTSTLGAHSFSVVATDNAGNSTTVTHAYTVDAGPPDDTAPTVTLLAPTAPVGFYEYQQVVNAEYSCADDAGGKGIASCVGRVPNGSPLDTVTASGARAFRVTATDLAGNTATTSATYYVISPLFAAGFMNSGESITTDYAGTGPTLDAPLQTAMTMTNTLGTSGQIANAQRTPPAPPGYELVGLESVTTIPDQTASNPLIVRFSLHPALVATAGVSDVSDLVVLRDGVPVAACTNPAIVIAAPEPCVFARSTSVDGDAEISVYTATVTGSGHHGVPNHWTFGRRVASTDATPPPVKLKPTVKRVSVPQGAVVTADYSCADEGGGSGLASCVAPVASGANIDTSAPGAHAFSVTGTDNSGNTTTASATYHVVAPANVSGSVGAGGTLATGASATADAPLQTGVTSPNAGTIAIAQGAVTQPTPVGYGLLGFEAQITAPAATIASPLALQFTLDAALLAAAGLDPSTVAVFRDGVPIGACTNPGVAIAAPDPCVFARSTVAGGDAEIGIYSSHASHWNFGKQLTVSTPVAITTTSAPSGRVGVAYAKALAGSGGAGPIAWSISAGTLPTGLTLDPSTGVMSGIPTAAGTNSFTVRATDTTLPVAKTATKALSINIAPTADPAGAKVGVPYWTNVAAFTGTAPYRWSITDGSLPGGLALDPATGVISGTPSAEGRFNFTVQVVDSARKREKEQTMLSIAVAPVAISIAPAALANASKGVKYSAGLTASGGVPKYTFDVTSGSLPAGLDLSPTGVLSGKPTTTRTYTFTITATDKFAFTGTHVYTISVT